MIVNIAAAPCDALGFSPLDESSSLIFYDVSKQPRGSRQRRARVLQAGTPLGLMAYLYSRCRRGPCTPGAFADQGGRQERVQDEGAGRRLPSLGLRSRCAGSWRGAPEPVAGRTSPEDPGSGSGVQKAGAAASPPCSMSRPEQGLGSRRPLTHSAGVQVACSRKGQVTSKVTEAPKRPRPRPRPPCLSALPATPGGTEPTGASSTARLPHSTPPGLHQG